MIKKMFKLMTISDIVLIGLIFSIALLSHLLLNNDDSKDIVEIKSNNKLIGHFSLEKNRIIEVERGIVVEIKNGKVRMKKSTCKNQLCVHQGWTNTQPIFCVPNKISIIIKSSDKDQPELIITK